MLIILLSISSLLASTAAINIQHYDVEEAERLFEEFITTHTKTYAHSEEKQKRFLIFKENLKEINKLNEISEDAVHGVTQFSDMTEEEYSGIYNGGLGDEQLIFDAGCKVITDSDLTDDAPDALDFRKENIVTPVKNQMHCTSCWAFATIGSIEGQYARRYKTLQSFSEQQLVDCLKCSGQCQTGAFMTSAISELKYTAGVELEKDYPYIGEHATCRADQRKAMVRITGCLNFQLLNEKKLKTALYKYGPIAIGLNANTFRFYERGIFNRRHCPADKAGHAVLLVGYGSENGKDYWIMKNSYGEKFGEAGYIRISRGENACGLMNSSAASAIIA